jgi:GH25 family lysozyme M1 (1,4-beta-N-acetylmuramidase)
MPTDTPSTVGERSVQSAQGEDRSSYQPVGAWTAVNKFGFAKATEGLGWTDPTFEANWKALRDERKFRGAYHFFHPNLDPEAQAEYFLEYVNGHGALEPGDMLVIDSEIWAGADGALVVGGVESASGTKSYMAKARLPVPPTNVGASAVGDATLAFLDKVSSLLGPQKDRHPIGVYTDLSIAAELGDCTRYFLWIAYPAYTAPPSVHPWHNWRFWQWEFGGGPGGGDRDAYNGTLPEMTEWIGTFKNPPAGAQSA